MANKLECRIYRRRKDMDKLRSSGGTTFSNVFAENPWWRELVDDYQAKFNNPYVAAARGLIDDVIG